LSLISVQGQSKLFLEHKTKSYKKRYLDLDREYIIKTIDKTYYYEKIIGFNEKTISILTSIKTDRDTTYIYSNKIIRTKDTIYTYTLPIYRQDTVVIPFADIQIIKKDWIKNKKWFVPFGWVATVAVLGVLMFPIVAIDEGIKGVREWAEVEAYFIGISLPPIFIVTRKTKYDLTKKWTLKAE
jgi:hypothetical protein